MKLLALDIGRRHTGIAYFDDATNIPMPLDTLTHSTMQELCDHVHSLVTDRHVDRVIVGLPLLPSGEKGTQAAFVEEVGEVLKREGIPLSYVDERYTTPRNTQYDGNASAACSLLEIALRN